MEQKAASSSAPDASEALGRSTGLAMAQQVHQGRSGRPASAIWVPEAGSPAARALAHIASVSRGQPMSSALQLTVQFHPDRLYRGEHLMSVLAREVLYRSQFETGTSNGGLTAHVGGDRWKWESRMFGGAYDDVQAEERPKYGALNYRR